MNPDSALFANWLDDFFISYYQHRPVNATFIGVDGYNHRLPDFSYIGVSDALADMSGLLERLKSISEDSLQAAEKIDYKLAEGFLRIQIWEYQSNHFQAGNPSVYTGEAVFGVMSLFLEVSAPEEGQVEFAIERLNAIPILLAQGKQNVQSAPTAWTERAVRECKGALAFLTDGITYLGIDSRLFYAAAENAALAFSDFLNFLETELSCKGSLSYACGENALDLYLRQGHFLEMDGDEIVRFAEAQMIDAEQYLVEHASDFGAIDKKQVLAGLADLHPTTERYYDAYTEMWAEVREKTEEYDLLSWPDILIRYVPRPRWARKAAPYLYFLYYRSPSVYKRKKVHDYLVTPIDAEMPVDQQEKLLRANNNGTIKLNHVVHHGSIGHHVQNWYVSSAASRIGQIAAVDCASRIAMFCGGTMAEGWACYATDLMSEIGFLTPLEQYAEYQSRKRMAARSVVDIRLHQGKFSMEEAAAYYEENAGMTSDSAISEAVKNSMFPGGAVMYLMGNTTIHKLRNDMKELQGNQFNLRQFHDQFLSYGSIPVSLISADMKRIKNYVE